ncbi:hypothetical protein BGX34_002721 [Mortierella sp. NVP85]|nr:hypothetical protein BGX34_002721 [Mortierella sp. NVP85]
MNSPQEFIGNRSPFCEDDTANAELSGELRTPITPLHFIESKVRQHLAAPLPIRQRSLPDIFLLTPLSHEAGALPASPFYQPGNKGLFLSVSCEGETSPSSPHRLHPIPELNSQCEHHKGGEAMRRRSNFSGHDNGTGDDYSDSENEGFLPSSLNDLLTTHERQRRQSRNEDIEPRSTMLPSPASGSLRDDRDEDEIRYSLGSRVLLSGKYLLIKIHDECLKDGREGGPVKLIKAVLSFINVGTMQDLSNDPRLQLQRVLSECDQNPESTSASISPLTMLVPGGSIYSHPLQDPSLYEEEESRLIASRGQESHYKERSTTPDPFCPFPQDTDEVQFAMDDDIAIGDNAGKQDSIKSCIILEEQEPTENFGRDATATMVSTKSLNRVVGSNLNVERQRTFQQRRQPPGTLTPVSLVTREEDDERSISLSGIDFSALSISDGNLRCRSNSIQQEESKVIAGAVAGTIADPPE